MQGYKYANMQIFKYSGISNHSGYPVNTAFIAKIIRYILIQIKDVSFSSCGIGLRNDCIKFDLFPFGLFFHRIYY